MGGVRRPSVVPPHPTSSRAGSVGPRSSKRGAAEMTGVWIAGFPAELARSALVRWAAAEVKSRIGQDVGEDDVNPRSIDNNCVAVLGSVVMPRLGGPATQLDEGSALVVFLRED